MNDVINQMRFDQCRRKPNRYDELLSITIFNSNNRDEQSTTELDGRFVQSQLLISCLLKMETTSTDKKEFISVCREHYKQIETDLKLIDEFEQTYEPEYSLWWYTRESFLYRLLNRALRFQNIDMLFLFRFFLRDLQEQLYQRRYPSSVRVYRGQLISIKELDTLKDSRNKLISVNTFFSVTLSPEVAVMYINPANLNQTLASVLFEIEADPCQDGVRPFADISKISWFCEEQEILMMIGSVFRLKNISVDDNGIWHIEMNLCSDNDSDLRAIYRHMQDQYGSHNTQLILFGNVLIDMANFDDAEKYLRRLLRQIPAQHKDIYKCYHALGKVLFEKGEYESSLNYLNDSLKALQISESDDSRIAFVYNSIGEVHQKKGEIKQALNAFEKALKIFRKKFTDNDENLAWCYNNLGNIYVEQRNYSKAYDYLSKALSIKTETLPAGHPCLGNAYINLGNIYYYRHDYYLALQNYEIAHETFKKSLTPRHPSIARAIQNMGIVYEVQGNFTEAMKYYKNALLIRERILSASHPDLIEIKTSIERISLKLESTVYHPTE